MSFVFIKFGPTSEKPRAFNVDCKQKYLYDQIKDTAFSTVERYARSKDAEIKHALRSLEHQRTAHARMEPRNENEEEGSVAGGRSAMGREPSGGAESAAESAVPDEAGGGSAEGSVHEGASEVGSQAESQLEEKDPFVVAQDLWLAEGERLDALKQLREKQAEQLFSGLTGYKELDTPDAAIEIRSLKDNKPVDFKAACPRSSASELLVPKQTYAIYRTDLKDPETGAELPPVPLFFDVESDPGPDYGKPAPGGGAGEGAASLDPSTKASSQGA